MKDQRCYRYLRSDFGELPVRLHHLDIHLRFFEDRVEAVNRLHLTSLSPELSSLDLDANELEIHRVLLREDPSSRWLEAPHEYHRKARRLRIHFSKPLERGRSIWVETHTTCFPSHHILEGIYRDVTPPGAPQQYMSQCQQWGFQRIMPIIDDCRAKCTMTTTLEGDARYTHLISNGNVSRAQNPEGRPVPLPDDPTRQSITYVNSIPMAPYLFISCAGTWDVLQDQVTYPSGRTVRLEYLVPPGRVQEATIPMEILKKAMLWIYETQGYEYPREIYRTICMEKSNYGGMENVGNTTLVTDAALVTEHSLDTHILYNHAVIVHEFEHNQCGSETTMATPFDMWLNEAYTVDVERRFMASVFDPTWMRLREVDAIRDPFLGPLAVEDGGYEGRIVREGFNDPDELVDSVTYVKAAEVIRMLRYIVGEEVFEKGRILYFQRYEYANADTDQFFACFEEASGIPLDSFKERWLYQPGYPKVTARVSRSADGKSCRVHLRQVQRRSGPFPLPLHLAVVDENGHDIPETSQVVVLGEEQRTLSFHDLPRKAAFVSLARDASFYGTLTIQGPSSEELVAQALTDPNDFNRVEAFRRLTDIQRIRLLHHPEYEVEPLWLELYGQLLREPDLSPALRAYFLRVDQQPLQRDYATWYPELVRARERLLHAINDEYRLELIRLLDEIDIRHLGPIDAKGIENRLLSSTILEILSIEDGPETHAIISNHLQRASTATDRVAALIAMNRTSHPRRDESLSRTYQEWHVHVTGYANYLRVVASGCRSDFFPRIRQEWERSTFDPAHPTWSRALLVTAVSNTKMFWTEEGIDWGWKILVALATINETVAIRILSAFQHVHRLREPLKGWVKHALERALESLDPERCPIVSARAAAYLESVS